MAWSVPRTWTAGEIPTAAQLNTDVRDNLNELALHTHAGGSGSGAAFLGNLAQINFADQAIPAAPGGTLTRVFTTATVLGWRNAGGTFFASTSGHEHTLARVSSLAVGSSVPTGATGDLFSVTNATSYGTLGTAGTYSTMLATAFAISGTGSRLLEVVAYITLLNANALTSTGTVRLERDGTAVSTIPSTWAPGKVTPHYMFLSSIMPSGTYTMAISVLGTSGGGSIYDVGHLIWMVEYKQS